MVAILIAFFCGVLLLGVLWISGAARFGTSFPAVVMGGYVLRLILQSFARELPLFSHGGGGVDSNGYLGAAEAIAMLWRYQGIHWTDLAGQTSLPQHLFAIPVYLNGGPTLLGCVSLVALAAGITVVNLASLAIELGASPRQTHFVMSLFYFDFAFLFYTSDANKDGLVVCFTMGILGAAIRLRNRWSPSQMIIGLVSAWALWYTRFYLVFVAVAPFLVGIVGFGSRARGRLLVGAMLVSVGLILVGAYTDILKQGSENASDTFANGTSAAVIQGNSQGGSGVLFDDHGSPLGAIGPKLAYALFSPFLWTGGSIGLQIAKIEALVWYFVVYRAYRAARLLDTRLLIMLLSFLGPCSLMYAMSVSNIGLIVRQRLVIVAGTTVLAAFYRPPERRQPMRSGPPGLSRIPVAALGARRSVLPRA